VKFKSSSLSSPSLGSEISACQRKFSLPSKPARATIYPENFLASAKEYAALSWATKQA